VICGGVIVNPGDLVLGDEDGVVVIPRARAEDIVARAEAAGQKSRAGRQSGKSYHARSGAEEKLRAIPGVVWQD
jgi:regulator of RNase E activity RraA